MFYSSFLKYVHTGLKKKELEIFVLSTNIYFMNLSRVSQAHVIFQSVNYSRALLEEYGQQQRG